MSTECRGLCPLPGVTGPVQSLPKEGITCPSPKNVLGGLGGKNDALRQQLAALKAQGAAAQLGVPRGIVYKLWREL